jgi:hypothetical protein
MNLHEVKIDIHFLKYVSSHKTPIHGIQYLPDTIKITRIRNIPRSKIRL